MKVYFILGLLLLQALQQAYGQTDDIRKLQQTLPLIRDSLRYVDVLNRVSLLFYEQNLDSTFDYAGKARIIARRLQYAKGMADATNNLGIVFDLTGNTPLALRYYNDAFNQYASIGDSSNMVQALMNIASVYNISGNDQKAVNNFKRALSLGRNMSHDSIMALVIYNFLLDYPGEFPAGLASSYIDKAAGIASKYHDTILLLAIEQPRADNYIKNGRREEGIKLLQQTASRAVQMKLYYMVMDPLIDLGDQFITTDTAKAVAYYKQALNISGQNNFHSYSKVITKKLYDFYSGVNNTNLAYYYSQNLLKMYEDQEQTNNGSGIDYIEYALKDQQLESVRARSAYSSMLLWLALTICIMALIIIIILRRNGRRFKKTHASLKLNFTQLGSTTEALETSNKNYARLIRVVAHDLRNPIGAINSISALILSGESLNDEDKKWLQLIDKSSSNCLQLIGELLETDFNAKEVYLHNEDINLSALLQQTVKLLGFTAQEKKQEVILHDAVDAVIFGDANKLSRVLNNLVVNAIKFSPEGGTVLIESQRTTEGILIAVKDTGIGIPATIADKLFDPFTNAKRKGTAGEPSFGLGLYISKQIIEAHNGRIWFESEPGKGTVFYVLLNEKKE